MTDAIQVFKPGWRALDANGDVIPGAVIRFFDAGTSNTREVFSDYGLSASLGTTVTCDAGGYPASDANAKVEVYTGNTAYKVMLETSAAVTVWSHDNIIGALDTSEFLTDADIVPSTPISNTSSNQAPASADKGTFYNVNCSGGDVTFTLDNASALGDGWFIKVRHDGTANAVLITGTGGELFKTGSHAGVIAFALSQRGQTVTISCDGVGFKVEESSPALFTTTGVILIADRLAVEAVGAAAGARYIATAADDWGELTVAEHDIVESNGQGGWFKITPPTNSGWVAYVQDESLYYTYRGSGWRSEVATATLYGTVRVADADAMEAQSAGLSVTADFQHRHPGHPKFNLYATVPGGVPTVQTSYNVTSVTDAGTGDLDVTIATDFSSANWAPFPNVLFESPGGGAVVCVFSDVQTAGTVSVRCKSASGFFDPNAYAVTGLGDQ